ncbi:hypothetical protein [Thioflexithrix psekupsensis]|uniref:hypothetical protein n=1 Tax=Thioflexithrix psekupsensis TaxID=1570016 RepID=UPI0015945337|nr:hypothetical protein [Thioflexithrix psekupsensis]
MTIVKAQQGQTVPCYYSNWGNYLVNRLQKYNISVINANSENKEINPLKALMTNEPHQLRRSFSHGKAHCDC